jgi:hypothetical protein
VATKSVYPDEELYQLLALNKQVMDIVRKNIIPIAEKFEKIVAKDNISRQELTRLRFSVTLVKRYIVTEAERAKALLEYAEDTKKEKIISKMINVLRGLNEELEEIKEIVKDSKNKDFVSLHKHCLTATETIANIEQRLFGQK